MRLFEITLKGFDGMTDETDHLIKWVLSDDRDTVIRWLRLHELWAITKEVRVMEENRSRYRFEDGVDAVVSMLDYVSIESELDGIDANHHVVDMDDMYQITPQKFSAQDWVDDVNKALDPSEVALDCLLGCFNAFENVNNSGDYWTKSDFDVDAESVTNKSFIMVINGTRVRITATRCREQKPERK